MQEDPSLPTGVPAGFAHPNQTAAYVAGLDRELSMAETGNDRHTSRKSRTRSRPHTLRPAVASGPYLPRRPMTRPSAITKACSRWATSAVRDPPLPKRRPRPTSRR